MCPDLLLEDFLSQRKLRLVSQNLAAPNPGLCLLQQHWHNSTRIPCPTAPLCSSSSQAVDKQDRNTRISIGVMMSVHSRPDCSRSVSAVHSCMEMAFFPPCFKHIKNNHVKICPESENSASFLPEKVACSLAVTKLPTAHAIPRINCVSESFKSNRKQRAC